MGDREQLSSVEIGLSGGRSRVILQLNRILQSAAFSSAPSLRRLLHHLVTESLDGRSHQLKEYALGVDVFDRGPGFDPKIDTIVRVQARRLRTKLEEYYDEDGSGDELIIELPRGHYVPAWRHRPVIPRPLSTSPASQRASGTRAMASGPGQPSTRRPHPAGRRPPRRLLYAAAGLAAIGLAGAATYQGWSREIPARSTASSIRSLAVLPLSSLSPDPDGQFFADAMTDGVIAELSRIGALKVISRTSSMRYRDATKPLPDIAQELGASGMVVGSILREGVRVRIAVQLIDAATDQGLWSGTFDGAAENVLDLQREVARRIAREIAVTLTVSEEAGFARATPVNPEAFRLYLMGRRLLRLMSHWTGTDRRAGDWEAARHAFERATAIDPTYAQAYVGLAQLHPFGVKHGFLSRPAAFARAEMAARKALDLDDGSADAHLALASIRLFRDWDWEGAERAFLRALELHPNSPEAHGRYAHYLRWVGRQQEAIEQSQRALDLDPLDVRLSNALGVGLMFARRFDEAIAQFRECLKLEPSNITAHYGLAMSYEGLGQHDQAVDPWGLWLRRRGEPAVAEAFEREYRAHGYSAASRLLFRTRLEQELNRRHPDPWYLAYFHARLDEKDEAFRWLERAYEDRNPGLLQIRVDSDVDNLRSDPRYNDLVRRIGFPESGRVSSGPE